MTDGLILAVDQGTSSTKAILVNEEGSVVARASRRLSQSYPRPAWVEQDPLAIWSSVRGAMDACLHLGGRPKLAAIAVTNQRETAMVWERATGQPLGPAIGWQCQRTAPFCAELEARGLEPLLRHRTGLTIDPMFSGSKARWLLAHIPEGRRRAERGDLCVGTMDSWVLWNLTGGVVHACDFTNASRTQLFDIRSLAWDQTLLDMFGVPEAALPQAWPSSAIYGTSVPLGLLPGGVPIASLIGDSHAALYGHASFEFGSVKATYGTGSSLMSATRNVVSSERGISSTIAWAIGEPHKTPRVTYALEGNIYATGAAVQWLGETLGLSDPGSGIEELASRVEDSGGVYFVPAFSGLGAPHWNDRARGLICGITLGTTPAHLARATLEAIACEVRDVFESMEADSGRRLQVLLADGGATRNDLLMQCQADILGRPVLRCLSPELSALGAAYLAGVAMGIWSSQEEIEGLAQPSDRFEPRLPIARREEVYQGWRQALARAVFVPTSSTPCSDRAEPGNR